MCQERWLGTLSCSAGTRDPLMMLQSVTGGFHLQMEIKSPSYGGVDFNTAVGV
jgi:hypothetical protein